MAYYPKLWEFVDLLAIVLTMCAGGYLLKLRWARDGETVPTPVALLMWMGAFILYFLITLTFFNTTPDERKLTILMWCLLFWTVPVGYFSYMVVDSLAARSIDRISPFSPRIEAPSEYADARKLALRGDIDGAVRLYRNYHNAQPAAFFEAARLMKSAQRYEQATLLLEELRTRFQDDAGAWAEATYLLAKLHDQHLENRSEAIALLRQLLDRAPESRHGQLAVTEVARLVALEPEVPDDLEDAETAGQDPFYQHESAPAQGNGPSAPPGSGDGEAAAGEYRDPFYRVRAKPGGNPAGNGEQQEG